MNWDEATLGDLCDEGGGEVKTGPFGSQLHQSDYSTVGTPVVMPKDIVAGRVMENGIARVGSEHVDRLSKHQMRVGDIVYGRRGDIGRCALITEQESGWLCGTGCLRITLGEGSVQPHFLFYFLNHPSTVTWIYNQAVGATMPNLNTGILRSVPIRFPSLPTQRRIASILSAYDDLIENNTRRIAILEEMARRLYEEWFVDFRFPGHETAEFTEIDGQSLPLGWEKKEVKQVVKRLKNGTVYKQKDVSPSGLTIVVDQSRAEYLGFHHNAADHEASAASPIIIFGDHTCKMQIMIVPFSLGPNTIAFTSAAGQSLYYLFGLVQGSVETKEYKRHWTELSKKKVLLADAGLSRRYDETVRPMFTMMEMLRQKNRNLRAQRDLLLPKLVSGDIDVSDAEKSMEAAE